MPGPTLRTDIVDVYVFRTCAPGVPARGACAVEFLQLRRAASEPLGGTWQPIMGHALSGERASATALRELREETGYAAGAGLVGLWALEEPNVYFLDVADAVMLGPCFAARVAAGVEPRLDAEHDAARWVPRDHADRAFLWPGQRKAIAQIIRDILEPGSAVEPVLRVQGGGSRDSGT